MFQRLIGIAALVLLGATAASCSNDPGETFPSLSAIHITDEETFDRYNSVPPTSGSHWNTPAPWGIYSQPIPNERQVHNLEHGGVIIQYNSEDPALINRLIRFTQSQPDFPCFLIVAPYPDMPFTIALTAWPGKPAMSPLGTPTYLPGVRDTLEEYDENRLQAFVNAYRNRGPELVSCVR